VDIAASAHREGAQDGVAVTVQWLRGDAGRAWIDSAARTNRRLIIVDDAHATQMSETDAVDRLLSANKESRVLYIAREMPAASNFEAEFTFRAELIVEKKVLESENTQVQIVRFSPSFALLRQLQRDPQSLEDLTWRQFEMVVAQLLEGDGYSVELMSGTKDGGVDVVAVKDLGVNGYFKALWQAKKHGKANKVGISLVRELADTRQQFGASKGIIVTSSYLTRGALERIERDKYLLGKVDRDDLDAWISRTLSG
jgi:HJR/Mrr/RecB family endonuclease